MDLKSKSNSLSDFVFFDMSNSFFLFIFRMFTYVQIVSVTLKIQSMNTYNDRSKATVSTAMQEGKEVLII